MEAHDEEKYDSVRVDPALLVLLSVPTLVRQNTGSFQRPTGGQARTGSDEAVSKAIQQALEDVELQVETEDESLNEIIDGRAKIVVDHHREAGNRAIKRKEF